MRCRKVQVQEIGVIGTLPSHLFIGTSALAAYSIDKMVVLLLRISKSIDYLWLWFDHCRQVLDESKEILKKFSIFGRVVHIPSQNMNKVKDCSILFFNINCN